MERLRNRLIAAVTGCLSTLLAAVMGLVVLINMVLFTVRDFATMMAPPGFRHTPVIGWIADQPRATPGSQDTGRLTCTLTWRRNAFTAARYEVECVAKEDVVLSDLAIVSYDQGTVPTDYSYEDQRPMSGETIEIEGGRTWLYDGELGVGWDLLPMQDAPRTIVLRGKIDYPEANPDQLTWEKRDHPEHFALELAASEPW